MKIKVGIFAMTALSLSLEPSAHAGLFGEIVHAVEKGAQWAGDRTGLKRPFEEGTGLAEKKRTEEARRQAQEAEAEAIRALAELENKKADLKVIQDSFEKFRAEATLYRSQVRKLVTPVNAKLLQMSMASQVISDSHRELVTYSAKVNTQIEAMNTALSHLVQAVGTGPLISEEDRALVRVLQLAVQSRAVSSPETPQAFEASLNMVSNRGRLLEEQIQTGFKEVHRTVKFGQWISNQSKSVHEDLLTLTGEIANMSSQIQTLSQSSLELDKKVKQ